MSDDNTAADTIWELECYTDGGCLQKEGFAGWGAYGELTPLGIDNPAAKDCLKIDAYGTIEGRATNNIAELMGLIRILEKLEEYPCQKAHFILDSEYVKKGAQEYLDGWSKNGWCRADGAPLKNVELWQRLHKTLVAAKERGLEVNYSWVKGHSGNKGNEYADGNASKAVNAAFNGANVERILITKANKFRAAPKVNVNRLLDQKHCYFKADKQPVSKDGRFTSL